METETQLMFLSESSTGRSLTGRNDSSVWPEFKVVNSKYYIEYQDPDPAFGNKQGIILKPSQWCEDIFVHLHNGINIQIRPKLLSSITFDHFKVQMCHKKNIFFDTMEHFHSLAKVAFTSWYFTSNFNSYLFTDRHYDGKNVKDLLFDNPFFNIGRYHEPSDSGFDYKVLLAGLSKIGKQMPHWVTKKFTLILDLDHFKRASELPEDLDIPHLYVSVNLLSKREANEDTSYKIHIEVQKSESQYFSADDLSSYHGIQAPPYQSEKHLIFSESYSEESDARTITLDEREKEDPLP